MTGAPVFDELPPPAKGQRRKRRRDLIRQFVAQYAVRSQGELVTLLDRDGVEATQATVSRDLEELGIAKLRGADGRVTYALPEPYGLNLILRQFALTIDASGNLAVITTPPGTAGAVAAAIDGAAVPDVLATVQGDDTVLVVAREPADGRAVADRLAALANPPPPLEAAVREHDRPAEDPSGRIERSEATAVREHDRPDNQPSGRIERSERRHSGEESL